MKTIELIQKKLNNNDIVFIEDKITKKSYAVKIKGIATAFTPALGRGIIVEVDEKWKKDYDYSYDCILVYERNILKNK